MYMRVIVLAQRGLFEDEKFIKYLEYLRYWKQPKYSKYLLFPQSLFYLDQLQQEEFRKQLVKMGYIDYLANQQFQHWRYQAECL